ncbi:MAG TPA: glycosyltransferase family 1 protein [Gemmobacter sp.]|nr:glycosyltransferase family 1 protein [Gemmobacter sp.]
MTTWLHITSSYTWTRPAVGVIRVEQKLFAALASQNLHDPVENDLRYCIFMGGEFFEVPASAMEIKPQNPDEVARPGLVMGMLWAFWLAVRALWLRLAAISPVAARAFQKAKALRNRRQQIKDGHQPWPVARIKPGDTFISVGHDWALDFSSLFRKVTREYNAKLISFCHDLIPVTFPEYCIGTDQQKMVAYFDELFAHSSVVLCNSICTERDVLEYQANRNLPAPKTLIVPLGCDVLQANDVAEADLLPDEDFILYVSTIERRKNHQLLYNVYAELSAHPDFQRLPTICFVGMQGWRVENLMDDIALNHKVSHKFKVLPHVTDAQLGSLYRRALFCVYPSYYEGWGLPVSEALALGKVVIASDAGALPEASGGFALHLGPYDTRAWRDAIFRMAMDAHWRQYWESRIATGFQPNTWSNAAAILLREMR